jgi:uncharacterized membrane protein YfcA
MTAFVTVYAFLKSQDRSLWGGDPPLKACTGGFWAWFMTPVVVFPVLMFFFAKRLSARHERRVACGYYESKYSFEGDIKWDKQTLKRFPLISVIAGIAAALLGIGGGMITGPVLLEMGVVPIVSTATTGFMINWTAASGVVQYIAAGKLAGDLCGWYLVFGILGGLLGDHGAKKVIAKTGRVSYLLFTLAAVILVSAFAALGLGIRDIADDFKGSFNFDTSCPQKN